MRRDILYLIRKNRNIVLLLCSSRLLCCGCETPHYNFRINNSCKLRKVLALSVYSRSLTLFSGQASKFIRAHPEERRMSCTPMIEYYLYTQDVCFLITPLFTTIEK